MIFVQFLFFAISFLATALLAPRPRIEDARPSTLDDLQAPRATEGAPVPIVYGKVRMRGPNTLWFGNFEATAIRKKQKTGLFSAKRVTVGFEYRVMLDLALCLGPGVRLHEIFIDKDRVFSNTTGLSASGDVANITEPELFGGRERGGGFVGQFVFYPGSFTEVRDPSLVASVAPDEYPSYVGISHLVLRGLAQTVTQNFGILGIPLNITVGGGTTTGAFIGESAQLRPFSFVLSRYPNGLSLADPTIGDDLNPMNALYDILTDQWGGAQVNPAQINVPSFTAAAATLLSEGNGISLIISRSQNVSDIVQEILRQIDAVMYQDPASALFTVQLIRNDFQLADLTTFDEDDIVEIRNFSRTQWEETFNQVRVSYTGRSKGYETASAFAQDLANIEEQGRVRSSNISFPGVTIPTTATAIATRELLQISVPLIKATIELRRAGADIRPGDPFILSWPDYGIDSIVMRATRYNLGELINGRIVLDCIQDVLSIPQPILAPPADTLFIEPPRDAAEITAPTLIEAPHWVVQHTGQEEIIPPPTVGDSYILAFARRPNTGQISFSVSLTQDDFVEVVNLGIDREPYNNSAVLDTAIGQFDSYNTGLLTSITISALAPTSTFLQSFGASERVRGAGLFFIGDEIFNYASVTDNLNGTFTLNNVRRALLDTTFQAHAATSAVHFFDIEYLVADEYSTALNSSVVRARFSSSTDIRDFGFENASNVDLTIEARFGRPLPPKNFTANTERGTTSSRTEIDRSVAISFTWLERSRDVQNIIEDFTASSVAEAGQTYEIDFLSDDLLTVFATIDSLTGTSTSQSVPAPVPSGNGVIALYSRRDGVRSRVADIVFVTYIIADWILFDGTWDDTNFWRDLANWNDGA